MPFRKTLRIDIIIKTKPATHIKKLMLCQIGLPLPNLFRKAPEKRIIIPNRTFFNSVLREYFFTVIIGIMNLASKLGFCNFIAMVCKLFEFQSMAMQIMRNSKFFDWNWLCGFPRSAF